jgi:hypothetical protein
VFVSTVEDVVTRRHGRDELRDAADCDDKAHQTVVVSETYATPDARDRAIRSYLTTVPGRAGQKNGLLTVGNTLITVPGPRDDAAFALLVRRLRQLGAQ